MTNQNKNNKLLKSFTQYCQENPGQRFWQALASWSGQRFIFFGNGSAEDYQDKDLIDTFYLEDLP